MLVNIWNESSMKHCCPVPTTEVDNITITGGIHGTMPAYMTDTVQPVTDLPGRRRLHSSSTSTLVLPYRWHDCAVCTIGHQAFPTAAARTWNSMPLEVMSSTTLSITQISTENLFVFPIISWPLIKYYSDCKVTAVLRHYPLKTIYKYRYIHRVPKNREPFVFFV